MVVKGERWSIDSTQLSSVCCVFVWRNPQVDV